jgi:hypothetical protein
MREKQSVRENKKKGRKKSDSIRAGKKTVRNVKKYGRLPDEFFIRLR